MRLIASVWPLCDDESVDDLVQLLTPAGQRVEHPDYRLALEAGELLGLYRDMVLVRRMDVEATALQRQGELGLWASCLGQEAAQVGSARAQRPTDMCFPSYREHGVAWVKGVEPLQILGLFRGVNYGGWDPRERYIHVYTLVIGSQALHATGYAMGVQRDDTDDAVVAYFGDGATSQGDLNEALVWASVNAAPVVFFCQNNQWAISEPVERQSRVPIAQRATGFGIPAVRVDGNDVLACHAVMSAALETARDGGGPVFIEAFTYRMGAHTTSDDPSRYRIADELESWRAKDPIDRMRSYLETEGILTADQQLALDADSDALAAAVRAGVLEMRNPEPLDMFDNVYAGAHPLVTAERASYASYLASFVDEARS
ncbi:MAG: 2-oxoisovalerate dehydrogenase component alpha subunit [Frankiaceae bacterium]|nr:2-oxoisovalerate dehydrogenase component alpha subunit [Frankiaceae bacterium]